MNAFKHGLRSKKAAIVREDSYNFEIRKQKWMAKVDASDDMGEFLAYQTVAAWCEIEHAEHAIAERTATLIDTAEDKEIETVYELGRRLFHDRCGSIAVYGNLPDVRSKKEREKKTSTGGASADPDDPAKLVSELEKTAFGCLWMRARWEEVREQLEPGTAFQSPDRLKAIRLLGRQPIDLGAERAIAEIFVASNALHPGKKCAFDDLLSDMQSSQLGQLKKNVRLRWPDLSEIDDADKGRAILVDLVDQNIERLNALIGEFEKKTDEIAQRIINNLRCDDTQAGHRMRSYLKNSRDALDRRMAKYDKYDEHKGRMNSDEQNPRRINDGGGLEAARRRGAGFSAAEMPGSAGGETGGPRFINEPRDGA